MSKSHLYGMGNEVLYFWGIIVVLIIILLICFPIWNRVYLARYEERLRHIRATHIGRINIHREESSYNFRSRANRRTRIDPNNGSRVSLSSGSSSSGSRSAVCCPICLEQIRLAVAPLCNHLMCGCCIFQYFDSTTQSSGSYRCPLCRRDITMITAQFTRDERLSPTDSALGRIRTDIVDRIMEYNRNYLRNNLTLWEQFLEMPSLVNHFMGEILTINGGMVPLSIRVRCLCFVLIAVLYWIMPFDLFPEAYHGLHGFVDDACLAICLIIYMNYVYRRIRYM